MYSQRSDVGAVGIKLYYPDNTIQHAGIILGLGGVAGHIFHRTPRDAYVYMYKMYFAQNFSAVTAACMMVKRSVFEEIGHFSEEFHVSYNDVDLCMKIRKANYLIVWTPYAEAYYFESKTRGYYDTPEKQSMLAQEVALFKEKWSKELAAGDPYYNCNFSLDKADYTIIEATIQ
jgi:GT2 family glycosyltransferase